MKKKRTNCKKKAVKKEWIEDLVVSQAQKLINDDLVLKDIAAVLLEIQEQENTSLPLYTQQLQEVERSIENLLNAIQQGIFTKSTKTRLEELEAKREELEFQIASEQLVKPKLTEENIMFWLHKFRGMDMRQKSHRQRLIDLFINRVYLYDDKLVITFNHKEGAETITLEDVETALADADRGSDLVSFAVPKRDFSHKRGVSFCISEGTRTHLNAGVRWTPAIRRLDAGCSKIESSPFRRTRTGKLRKRFSAF